MLTKEIILGSIEILEDKTIQVREDTVVFEDGKELSRTFLRYVLNPGEDVSTRPQIIQAITGLLWTPEVIADWRVKHPQNPFV